MKIEKKFALIANVIKLLPVMHLLILSGLIVLPLYNEFKSVFLAIVFYVVILNLMLLNGAVLYLLKSHISPPRNESQEKKSHLQQ